MVPPVRVVLAGGAIGIGAVSIRLVDFVATASHRHHPGSAVCIPSVDSIPPSSRAGAWEEEGMMQ